MYYLCARLIFKSCGVVVKTVEKPQIFRILFRPTKPVRNIVVKRLKCCRTSTFTNGNEPFVADKQTTVVREIVRQRTSDSPSTKENKTQGSLKLDSAQFQSIFTPQVKKLVDIFRRHNYEIRIAGGAVRDLLLDRLPQDIDFATMASPTQMKEMFIKEEIRIIENRGDCHGTITTRINEKQNFEITTLHSYVIKENYHPEVKFTTDWELDASRRDLTVNSMFLDLDGTVYDYCEGLQDLKQRKVQFVQNAKKRIQEDYLRILRYFRFYGHLALNENSHDPQTLEAIQQNASGLTDVFGKRLWFELKKILSGNHNCHLLKLMIELGLAPFLGLPEYPDVAEFDEVWARASMLQPRPMTMLVALISSPKEFAEFHQRMKLPSYEYALGLFLMSYRNSNISQELLYNQAFLDERNRKMTPIVEFVQEVLKYQGKTQLLEEFSSYWRHSADVT